MSPTNQCNTIETQLNQLNLKNIKKAKQVWLYTTEHDKVNMQHILHECRTNIKYMQQTTLCAIGVCHT